MFEEPKNVWPKTIEAQNTLFFAQCLRGFLDQATFEGFRAYSLDTVARLREAIEVSEDVIAQRMRDAVLPSVAQELSWSFSCDDAAQRLAPGYNEILLHVAKQQKISPHELASVSRAILRKIEKKYRGELIDEICLCLPNLKSKSSLLSVTGYLASNLLCAGYDRNFILGRVDDRFFDKNMHRTGEQVVRSFLQSIENLVGDYWVVVKVSPLIERVLRSKPEWEFNELSSFPAHVQAAFSDEAGSPPWDGTSRFAKISVRAPDSYRAAIDVWNMLEEANSSRVIQDEHIESALERVVYVYRNRGNVGMVFLTEDSPLPGMQHVEKPSARSFRNVEKASRNLEREFDIPSKDRIKRAISTAGMIIKSHLDEVRLISLWSSFEILLGDPPGSSTRIDHFLKALIPLVVVRYHRRMFAAMHDQLLIQHPSAFKKLMKAAVLSRRGTPHTQFAKLMVVPQFEDERRALISICGDNPLLRHRIWRLHDQFATPHAAKNTIEGHADRVNWQLNRIYRVRNTLVHAGKSPEVLETLVQNCMEYLRTAVLNIIRVGGRSHGSIAVDDVISEIAFDWTILRRTLEGPKDRAFDEDLAHSIFKAL